MRTHLTRHSQQPTRRGGLTTLRWALGPVPVAPLPWCVQEVKVPEYDMKVSEPMDEAHWVPMRLGQPGGVVIMEGIHCLNPTLTSRVAAKDKFRIAISPLSSLVLDDLTLVK